MSFIKTNEDITKLDVEAIVIGANAKFKQGNGINKEIFRKAGADKLKQEIHGLIRYRHKFKTGDCIVTSGGNTAAKRIIHTITPIWFCGIFKQKHKIILLDSCYKNALITAESRDLKTVAFPLLGAGFCGFPKKLALDIAEKAIKNYLKNSKIDIFLVICDILQQTF